VTDFEIYGSLYIFGIVTDREFVFGTLHIILNTTSISHRMTDYVQGGRG